MHVSQFLVLALAGIGRASPSQMAPSPLSDESSLLIPHYHAEIALEDFESSTFNDTTVSTLTPRTNILICTQSLSNLNTCLNIASHLKTIGSSVASLLKDDSNGNDCETHSGSIDSVAWQVYATGGNCDTTAQVQTIQGAIDKYLRQQDSQVCGVHCLKLTHGGTWTGYVIIAAAGQPLNSYYCGSSGSFGNCVSGGEGDV